MLPNRLVYMYSEEGNVEAAFSPLKTAIRIMGQSSEYIELGAFDT